MRAIPFFSTAATFLYVNFILDALMGAPSLSFARPLAGWFNLALQLLVYISLAWIYRGKSAPATAASVFLSLGLCGTFAAITFFPDLVRALPYSVIILLNCVNYSVSAILLTLISYGLFRQNWLFIALSAVAWISHLLVPGATIGILPPNLFRAALLLSGAGTLTVLGFLAFSAKPVWHETGAAEK